MVGVVVVVVRVNLGYSSAGIYTNRESEDTGFRAIRGVCTHLHSMEHARFG
jgi:hypothetical protein